MATLTIRDILLLQQADLAKVTDGPGSRRGMTMPGTDIPVIVITGPRRAGKTFLALRHLSATGAGTFGYIDLGDERLGGVADPGTILAAIDSVYGRETVLFLDGVSHLVAWEEFVDRLVREERRVVIADSRRDLFSPDIRARFAGRYCRVMVLPFSFREYLAQKPHGLTVPEKIAALRQYAESGGFPEPLLKKISGREYLQNLFDAIVYRDVVQRHNIRSVQGIGTLALHLLSAPGTEHSYGSLARATRGTGTMTVKSHLAYLEDAFLFFSIPRFSFVTRKRVPANKNIYCTDTGFIAARGHLAPEKVGKLYENLVAIELLKHQQDGLQVSYWKNVQGEVVDFVVHAGDRIAALIQVCADLTGEKIKSRKIRALLKASRDLRCTSLLLLSEQEDKTEDAEWFGMHGTVRYIPLWKWLEGPETALKENPAPCP